MWWNLASRAYFVYVVLGHQGFRYSKSNEVLNTLIETGRIEQYDKAKDDFTIPSIRIKDSVQHSIEEEKTPIVEVEKDDY